MLKVLKNLKESTLLVFVIFVLLCIQAACDLNLPDFTSKIVNTGIQQSGIEYAVPDVITSNDLENLMYFTDEDSKILNNYEAIEKTDENIKKYPELKNQDIYELKDISSEEKTNLENVMSKPLAIIYQLSNEQTENEIKENIISNMNTISVEDNNNLDSNNMVQMINELSIIDLIKQMPDDQRNIFIDKISSSMGEMSDSIIKQAAIQSVKNEYEIIGIDLDSLQNKYILIVGLQMAGVALISMASAVTIMFLSSRVAAKLGKTLREKLFKKVLSFSTAEFNKFSTASLITRSTNDVQQIQQLITMLFRVLVYAPIMGIGGVLRVIRTGTLDMAWVIALAVIVVIAIVLVLFIIAMPKFKKMQSLIDRLNLVSREILTGIPVIRAFNTQKREEKRFDMANTNLMKNSIFVNKAMSLMMPAMMFTMQSVMILIIWVGGHNVDQGIMQVGDMMAFLQYTMQIVMSFLMISIISILLPRASVSANRINEVLDTEPQIKDKPINEQLKFDENKKGLVEFKNVSFRYPDADSEILEDIDFTAESGKTTAIIGSTGSGKSTLVNLIPRFYDVTGGELLVDGVNIKDVSQKELRSKIGFVPQKGVLFSGTIESNIKYGKDNITDEEMVKAASIAQATEFIEKKEEKYLSPISQGGNNVSGGQKQRLSIARALAIDPEIYVFDDSFSALDLKTDKALREALNEQTENKTVIIVAQRISTIMNADQIIVLEEGKIVGKGTHEELLKNCETYRQIALSQLSKEELNIQENGKVGE